MSKLNRCVIGTSTKSGIANSLIVMFDGDAILYE